MIEYKIYELFHTANKKRLHQKEILLRQSQEDIEYLRNIFSVLLPERFIREIRMLHLRPPADPGVSRESIHLQLRQQMLAPESVTPSVSQTAFSRIHHPPV